MITGSGLWPRKNGNYLNTTIQAVLLLLLFSVVWVRPCNAQGSERDSLLGVLARPQQDTNRVKALCKLGVYYSTINIDSGFYYSEEAMELAKSLGWENGISSAFNVLGVNYWNKTQYSQALEHFQKAKEINERLDNKPALALNLVNMGMTYVEMFNFPEALKYYNAATDIYEETGISEAFSNHLNNLGNLYTDQENYEKAIKYFTQAKEMNEKLGNKKGISYNLCNMGIAYEQQHKLPEAQALYQQSLAIQKEINDSNGMTGNFYNMGDVAYRQANYIEALDYFKQSFDLSKKLDIAYGRAINLGGIGRTYVAIATDTILTPQFEGNYTFHGRQEYLNEGIQHLEKAISLLRGLSEKGQESLLLNVLSKAQAASGDYKAALDSRIRHQQLKDSIYSAESKKKFAEMEAGRDLELKDKQIEIQKLHIQKNRTQRRTMVMGLIFLALIITGLIYFLVLLKRQKSISENLLLNILPSSIAIRLKRKENYIADKIDEASILFIDLVNFTQFSNLSGPRRVVEVLNEIFTTLDHLAERYKLEKIKTIGDSYMAAAGVPEPLPDHAIRAANMAIEIQQKFSEYRTADGTAIVFRIGIDCGEVMAGVIGEKKFIYDLWGDAVNTASRMESHGRPGEIHVTDRFKEVLQRQAQHVNGSKLKGGNGKMNGVHPTENYLFIDNGPQNIKGKGIMQTWFLREVMEETIMI